jgi:hypothetical protein
LRRLVVGIGERRDGAVLEREGPHPPEDADQAPFDETERVADPDLVGVVGHVRGRRAPVDDSARGRRRFPEDADVRHDVVACLLLLAGRGLEVDVGEVRAHLRDRLLRNGKAQPALLLREPEPEPPPRLELALSREEGLHLRRRVAAVERAGVRVRCLHLPTRRS